LEVIRQAGGNGMTDPEISERLGRIVDTTRARRIELVEAGAVVDSGRWRKTPTGRWATVWIAAGSPALPLPRSRSASNADQMHPMRQPADRRRGDPRRAEHPAGLYGVRSFSRVSGLARRDADIAFGGRWAPRRPPNKTRAQTRTIIMFTIPYVFRCPEDFAQLRVLLADVDAVLDGTPTRRRRRPDIFGMATRPAPRRSSTPPASTPTVPADSILPRRTQIERAAAAEYASAGSAAVLGVDEASYVQTRLVDEGVIDLQGREVCEPAPPADRSHERDLAAIAAVREYVDNGGEEKRHCTRDQWVETYLRDLDFDFEPF
jgi:hypothetical protein